MPTYDPTIFVDDTEVGPFLEATEMNKLGLALQEAYVLITELQTARSKDVYRIKHNGSDYEEARPSTTLVAAGSAEYAGPTEPTDWLDGDTWIERA